MKRTIAIGVTTALLALAWRADATAPDQARPTGPDSSISWTPCPANAAVQCGQVSVPIDWARPDGERTLVGVARRPADDPSHRVGTLFFNPGGPGYTGVDTLTDAAELVYSATLLARFDIVVVDPRGVGTSTPVHCEVPILAPGVTLFPRSQQQFNALVEHNRAVGQSCLDNTGDLLRHVDTVSVARDHEAVRMALAVPQVTWLMTSYGAQVGANYAELFPDRVRALVIDGALDHAFPTLHSVLDEARSVEDSFDRFVTWCRTAQECALRGRPVARLYDELVRRADRSPMLVDGAIRPVTGEDIRMNTEGGLLFKEPVFGPDKSWAGLSRGIAAALDGDATAFAAPPPEPTDGSYAGQAVACLDYPADVTTYRELRARMLLVRKVAPHLQGASQFWTVHSCIGWPVPVTNPPRPVDVHGVRTLIVNATHDPSTPYSWALSLARQIHGSSLLTRVGDGHTSYDVSLCARRAVDKFLISPGSTPFRATCIG